MIVDVVIAAASATVGVMVGVAWASRHVADTLARLDNGQLHALGSQVATLRKARH